MFKLVKYEFRKMWSLLTIISIALLIILTVIFNVMGSYFHSTVQVIKNDGTIEKGVKAHFILRKESEDIKGVLDEEYLKKLVKEYNSSEQKKVFKDKPHMMKYRFVNYFINAINYGANMMPFYGDLDFDFLNSEEEFYNKYKNYLEQTIKENNEYKGIQKYTDKQIEEIKGKINKLEFPLKVGYNKGLTNFIETYSSYFTIFLIVIVFSLSTVFSKDTNNGVDELLLSSKFGRKKSMNAKIIAGNLFSILVYLIYIFTSLLIHGIFASLDGFGTSSQMFWVKCILNISLGTGILIMLFKGLLCVLVISNLVMFISMLLKNSKLSTITSIGVLFALIKLTYTTDMLKLALNPIYIATHLNGRLVEFETYYFIGEMMISYTLIAIILSIIYLIIIRVSTVIVYRRYNLN